MVAMPHHSATEADYLALDRTSETKYEFVAGEIHAMAGASRWHNLITGNLIALIRPQLRGRACTVYPSDQRVKIPLGHYVYPDLAVVCGDPQFETIEGVDTLFNPTVIMEVLSTSTQRYDETEKFTFYRAIPSLREYVLIHTRSMWVVHIVRFDGMWQLQDRNEDHQRIVLGSIGCEMRLLDIYEDVIFSQSDE